VPGVDELEDGDPEKLVRVNALRKAQAASEAGTPARGVVLEMPASHPKRLVIACDTDVVLDGQVLVSLLMLRRLGNTSIG